jgi:hypothetical protein
MRATKKDATHFRHTNSSPQFSEKTLCPRALHSNQTTPTIASEEVMKPQTSLRFPPSLPQFLAQSQDSSLEEADEETCRCGSPNLSDSSQNMSQSDSDANNGFLADSTGEWLRIHNRPRKFASNWNPPRAQSSRRSYVGRPWKLKSLHSKLGISPIGQTSK